MFCARSFSSNPAGCRLFFLKFIIAIVNLIAQYKILTDCFYPLIVSHILLPVQEGGAKRVRQEGGEFLQRKGLTMKKLPSQFWKKKMSFHSRPTRVKKFLSSSSYLITRDDNRTVQNESFNSYQSCGFFIHKFFTSTSY